MLLLLVPQKTAGKTKKNNDNDREDGKEKKSITCINKILSIIISMSRILASVFLFIFPSSSFPPRTNTTTKTGGKKKQRRQKIIKKKKKSSTQALFYVSRLIHVKHFLVMLAVNNTRSWFHGGSQTCWLVSPYSALFSLCCFMCPFIFSVLTVFFLFLRRYSSFISRNI